MRNRGFHGGQFEPATDEWRKEIERNFWAANFLTGDKVRKFMHDEDQKFRAIWKEIGTTQ